MAIFFWSEPPPYYYRKQLLRDPWELEELRTGGSRIFSPSSTESCESMCTVVEGEVEWRWGSVCRLPMPPPVGNEI